MILSSKKESIFHQFYEARDPYFYYLRQQYKQGVSNLIAEEMNLNRWISINQVISLSLKDYEEQDEFIQEAIYQAVAEVIEERNKQQKAIIEEIKKEEGSSTPYVSPMSSIPKPSFSF